MLICWKARCTILSFKQLHKREGSWIWQQLWKKKWKSCAGKKWSFQWISAYMCISENKWIVFMESFFWQISTQSWRLSQFFCFFLFCKSFNLSWLNMEQTLKPGKNYSCFGNKCKVPWQIISRLKSVMYIHKIIYPNSHWFCHLMRIRAI